MLQTLTDICKYLKNLFEHKKYYDTVIIKDGALTGFDGLLQNDQYYRIVGSVFNDGVHKFGDVTDVLKDETFDGSVWAMAIPPTVIALASDVKEWIAKYGGVDSPSMSPYNSESFAGYSYSKSGGSTDGTGANSWESTFGSKLAPYRKI